MSDDLVKRLRDHADMPEVTGWRLLLEAADKLEAYQRALEAARRAYYRRRPISMYTIKFIEEQVEKGDE